MVAPDLSYRVKTCRGGWLLLQRLRLQVVCKHKGSALLAKWQWWSHETVVCYLLPMQSSGLSYVLQLYSLKILGFLCPCIQRASVGCTPGLPLCCWWASSSLPSPWNVMAGNRLLPLEQLTQPSTVSLVEEDASCQLGDQQVANLTPLLPGNLVVKVCM